MTVRIGLIGAGGMGRAHLARIAGDLSGGQIAAVADINHEAAVSAAEPYGAKAYDSADELINDPEVDAVLIATFGRVHAPDVIKAIEAGKYVLCEKPLATTAEDCIAIMEAEAGAGKNPTRLIGDAREGRPVPHVGLPAKTVDRGGHGKRVVDAGQGRDHWEVRRGVREGVEEGQGADAGARSARSRAGAGTTRAGAWWRRPGARRAVGGRSPGAGPASTPTTL